MAEKHEREPHNEQGGVVTRWWLHPPLRNALLSGLIAGTGFVLAHLKLLPTGAENYFYWIAIPLGAWHWTRAGIEELIEEREIGIEILMLAATVGSGILGLWDEAAALVFLYGAAEGVEEYTFARTRASIRALLDLAPKEAHVLRAGREIAVPAESVQRGDVFVARVNRCPPMASFARANRAWMNPRSRANRFPWTRGLATRSTPPPLTAKARWR